MNTTAAESGRPPPGGTAVLGTRTVARIGFGAMQLDRLREEPGAVVRLVRRAVELGADHLDTSQFYGYGFVNDVIRQAVKGNDDVTVVTKVGADPGGPLPMRAAQRPAELRASAEDNLRSLGVDRLPVVNLRRMDSGHGVPLTPDQVVGIDDQLAEMTAMRDEGLIGGIGLSSTTLETLRRALPAGIACVQNAYSLVDRGDEAMLELCRNQGIAWVPYFPLGSAFPGLPKVTDEPGVQAVAGRLGASPSQIGLAWLLQHSANTLLIPGTASEKHLEANLAAGSVQLDADATEQLDRIPAPAPARPQ